MVTTVYNQPSPNVTCRGYCLRCNRYHSLNQGDSRKAALALMAELENKGRIDLLAEDHEANPQHSLDYLYGPALGQMFGVLEYRAPDGSLGILRAFSGQYNGTWQVEGWAPPLFDKELWQETNCPTEKQIKTIGRRIDQLASDNPLRLKLIKQRKSISQQLMKELHDIYRLTNFNGETKPLKDVFLGQGGIPTGTGDCCAPKLLNHAARHHLTPLGISEFYMGCQNRSQTKQHGTFYPSCAEKCQPILGFLLCGLDKDCP